MAEPNKASDKAKASLFRQQIALLDMIEEATQGNEAEWESYIFSVAPAYELTAGKLELRHSRNISIHYMRQFRDSVLSGATPSAALLIHIAELCDKYLEDDSGTLSLDEAFKLRHRPRLGNPLKQEQWLQNRGKVFLAMWIQRRLAKLNGKKLSITKAAGIVINKFNLTADDESLKKEYGNLEVDKSVESGCYPTASEEISDLEKKFEDLYQAYTLGIMPEKPCNIIDRMDSKNTLKTVLLSCIKNLGKK